MGATNYTGKIRIENTLTDGGGREVKLKRDAHVKVTVEADAKDTPRKN